MVWLTPILAIVWLAGVWLVGVLIAFIINRKDIREFYGRAPWSWHLWGGPFTYIKWLETTCNNERHN